MKHEIHFELQQDKKIDIILEKIKDSLPKDHLIIKMANTDTVNKLIKKMNIKIDPEIINSVISDYRIFLNPEMPLFMVNKLVEKLRLIDGLSSVTYHGKVCSTSESFEFASLKGKPERNPDFFEQQHHFLSPLGVDSMAGWSAEGGSGEGINIFISDVSVSEHPDIEYTLSYPLPEGTHASSIIGILAAKNNDISCIGIVPDAKIYLSGHGDFNAVYEYGKPGDVVSLSIADIVNGVQLPWPCYAKNRAHIILSTALGITTCYASGNWNLNLDEAKDIYGKFIFNKNHPDYIENTGLCVGAASMLNSISPDRTYNYGSVVGAFAQGAQVKSIHGHATGTSFSAPIIAGIVAQIQSLHTQHYGAPLPPAKIIELITNPANGVPGKIDYEHDHAIMPDMRKILATLKIKPTEKYPENYGVTNEEIERPQHLVEKLFMDDNHSALAPTTTLEDIVIAENESKLLKPCAKKIELLKLIDVAFFLYGEQEKDELLEDNNFTAPSDAWTNSGDVVEYSENGVTLADPQAGGSLGVLYRKPVYFNSEGNVHILSADFEVLEWSSNGEKEVVIGSYLPGLDMIIYPEITKVEVIAENTTHIEMMISGKLVSFDDAYPGFGIRNAEKILVRKISLHKVK